jgi:alpha-mannosidase
LQGWDCNPDPKADLGKHSFTYSLYPHAGDWRFAKTPQKAVELNGPMTVVGLEKNASPKMDCEFFLKIDKDHVLLSALKKSDDGNGIIVRVYEDQNRRAEVNLKFSKKIIKAVECDPYEAEIGPVHFKDNYLTFDINPFEVRTFLLNIGV